MAPQEQYEQYLLLHRGFSETYSKVYKQVTDFYPLPQKFILEAAPEIDGYVEGFWEHKNDPHESDSFRDLVFFANNFQAFTLHANHVFNEYKELHSESDRYIKTIFRLKEKKLADVSDYAQLVPVLNKLITGFQQVKQKTDEAAKKLRQLQADWGSIKEKMNHGGPPIQSL
jgi:hypothetical protein